MAIYYIILYMWSSSPTESYNVRHDSHLELVSVTINDCLFLCYNAFHEVESKKQKLSKWTV